MFGNDFFLWLYDCQEYFKMKNKYWEGKSVIVTGGSGFLGSHFIEELIKSGAEVLCISKSAGKRSFPIKNLLSSRLSFKKIDLLDFTKLKKGLGSVDLLINCAAMDGNTEFKIKHAAEMMDINVRIASNLLNAAKERKINNIVLVSTAEIYSPQAESPIVEEDDHRKYNDYIGNGYVLSKRYSEILGTLYEEQYSMNIFLPRPTNMYGPGDHFGDQINRVIPSMIKKVLKSDPIEIWGDGSQVRQFIYVKDAVRSMLKMVEANKTHCLNIADGKPVSILRLAKLITRIIGAKENIFLNKDKPTGVKSRVLDTTKLEQIVNFKFKPLREGIKSMIEWYKKESLK